MWIRSIVALLGYFCVYRQNLFTPTRQIMPVDPLSRIKAKFFTKIGHLLQERKLSSTWRGLKTVELALISFAPSLRGTQIAWFSDNTANVVSIVHSGSKVPELQDLALRIFHVCVSFEFHLR